MFTPFVASFVSLLFALQSASLTFEGLSAMPPPAAEGVVELVVRWNAATAAPPAPDNLRTDASIDFNQFAITEQRSIPGSLPVHRDPQPSADDLVVVGADSSGAVVSWSLVKNPRIVRAEFPGPDGTLTGQVLYRESMDLHLYVADSPQVDHVVLYQPRWTGTAWVLDVVATLPLTR